jgi:hypothetical protein
MFPSVIDDTRMDEIQRISFFLTTFTSFIPTFTPPESFVTAHFQAIAFSRASLLNDKLLLVKALVERTDALYPDVIWSYITENFNPIAKSNFSSLLVSLEALNEKMPIVGRMAQMANSKQVCPLSELVCKAFEHNEGEISNVIGLVRLLNLPQLEEPARGLIWSIIHETMPALEKFNAAFSYHGDWVQLAKYLLKIEAGQTDQLVECAENSIDAFALAYSWMVKNIPDVLGSQHFAVVILKMDVGNQVAVIESYVDSLISRNGNRDEVIAPLVSALLLRIRFLNILEVPEHPRGRQRRWTGPRRHHATEDPRKVQAGGDSGGAHKAEARFGGRWAG